ncbi:hypothetical protein JAAARDRAFT_35821 [Jaapia argillacea MUCL 33604]|uniref:NmrA-like domain-containing protein n=1 Tax=Jaapia argillacea MUCL 33604 TaxID=933084 RepID=A0A067PR22_9AGAM|nr:hypothetical protein JAAARDRAFT_35821 [Jaapia argillacea MUCL 33604]
MSGYKTFAIAGAGTIGAVIVEEYLKLKDEGTITSVIVLTRTASAATSNLATKGAKIVTVDYDSPSSLEAALSGVDVLVSSLGSKAVGAQGPLAEAAKKAGVQLFVPSEFGINTAGHTEGRLAPKAALHKKLEQLDLPYALYQVGFFSDTSFIPAFGWDLAKGVVTIYGEGNTPISWTSSRDIARFVAYSTTALPREKVEWRTFRIEADRKSLNEVLSEYEEKSGKKLNVTRVSRKDLQDGFEKNPQDSAKLLQLIWERGGGVIGRPDELANSEWPEWNPVRVIDTILGTRV